MGDQASKPQDQQSILLKIENVREQGERLSRGFSARVEQMTQDCTEALERKTATGDGKLSCISWRVELMSEIISNLTLKLEDAFGDFSCSGASPSIAFAMEKSYTEVMERIEMLEGSSAKLEASCVKNEHSLIQVKQDSAKVEALVKINEQSILQAKQDTAKVEALSLKNQHALLQAKQDTEFQTIKLDKLQSKVVNLDNVHGKVLNVENRLIKNEEKHLELEKEILNLQSGLRTSLNRSSDRPTDGLTDTEDIRKVWYQIEASSQRIKTLEEDIGNLRDELNENGRKAKDVEDSINMMHINNLQMSNENKNLSKELAAIRDTQTDFTARLFEFERESTMKSEMIEDKISHLQHLKKLLNKILNDGQPKLRDMVKETKTQLDSLNSDMNNMKTQLVVMGRPKVGFTARFLIGPTFTPGPDGVTLRRMSWVITNVGNCYHQHQSHFIAPHPGLYCFCVKVEFCKDEDYKHFDVDILMFTHTRAGEEYNIPINTGHSTICTLKLQANQHVYLLIKGETGKTVEIYNSTSFSGWAIEYY